MRSKHIQNFRALVSMLLVFLIVPACQNSRSPVENPVINSPTPNNSNKAILLLPNYEEPMEVTYEVIGDQAIFEGDIIIGSVDADGKLVDSPYMIAESEIETEGMGHKVKKLRWPKGIVPFKIHKNVSKKLKKRVVDAITHWEAKTPIDFVKRTGQANFVLFKVHKEQRFVCSSYVGMRGGEQEILLHPECPYGTILHEIGHAVGLLHEHNRIDRNNHVKIIWDNIIEIRKSAYAKHVNVGFDIGDYDYDSIMHYGKFFNCKKDNNGKCVGPTIKTKPPGTPIGQRKRLSSGDRAAVKVLYPVIKPTIPKLISPGSTSSPGPKLTSTTQTLKWSNVSGATRYRVAVRDMTVGGLVVDKKKLTSTSLSVNLTSGHKYRWNASACNSAGCSEYNPSRLYFRID